MVKKPLILLIFHNFLSNAKMKNGLYDMINCFQKTFKKLRMKIKMSMTLGVKEWYYLNKNIRDQKALSMSSWLHIIIRLYYILL